MPQAIVELHDSLGQFFYMGELQIVVRKQLKGRQATPWLEPYRERFAKAAREASKELEGTKLRGADRVMKFNQLVKEKLSGSG